MNIFRKILAGAFVAAISAAAICAQQQPARPTVTPASTGSATVPESRIALINSEALDDEKTGILKLAAAIKRVDSEFTPRKTELQTLQQQIDKATADLQKASSMQDPKVTQQQQERIDQMTKEGKRKAEDAQVAYQKRFGEIVGPIEEEIGKALVAYAQSRGITLVVDVAKLISVNPQGAQQFPLLYFAPTIDITQAFITEFNSKNPTASVTTPK